MRNELEEYPWTIGWQPDYVAEGRLYGTDIRQNKPNAKIAILYQNDSYGKDYLIGFKSALGTAKVRSQIVGEEPFEVTATSPQSQLVKLRGFGRRHADHLRDAAADDPDVRDHPRARLEAGEHLRQFRLLDGRVHDDGSRLVERRHGQRLDQRLVPEGSGFADICANDATVKQYLALMAKYNPRGRTSDGLNFYGFAKAHSFVQAMYKAGKNPTRAEPHAGDAQLQRDEPVRPAGRPAEVVRDRPLHHLAAADDAVQQRRLGPHGQARRRAASRLAAHPSRGSLRGRHSPAPELFMDFTLTPTRS